VHYTSDSGAHGGRRPERGEHRGGGGQLLLHRGGHPGVRHPLLLHQLGRALQLLGHRDRRWRRVNHEQQAGEDRAREERLVAVHYVY
jgi:hypothetical protein